MNKTVKIYAVIFLGIALILGILEISKKEVLDWRKNFETDNKSPFGLYVFDQEINTILKSKVIREETSPYVFFNDSLKKRTKNILIIEKILDDSSVNELLKQANKGANVYIFGESFSKSLQTKLRFLSSTVNYEDTNVLKLTDLKLNKDSIILDKFPGSNGFYYVKKDQQILGKSDYYPEELQANFLKIKYGKGHFYLNSEPVILTNYYLLNAKNKKYIEGVFSYFTPGETIWFIDMKSAESRSPLRFILANPPLRYAWYLLLASLLIFVLFNVKRKQRIVPVIDPLKNTSADFIKSIGNLYLQEGNTEDMMRKKIQYFLHYVRVELMIDTKNLGNDFVRKVHLKTGVDQQKINNIVTLINKVNNTSAILQNDDLSKVNDLVDQITKRK